MLAAGGLVAIPTETVYGLAANALDAVAVARIFEAKNRPAFDPLIVHVHSAAQVHDYVTGMPSPLAALADAFWPGPLTLLLPRRDIVPDLVTSGLPRVAVRVPAHPVARELLASLDFPLAAPSANPFGYISPTQADHVEAQLGDRIDLILDGGVSAVGLESTIVGIDDDTVTVYRLGGLAIDEIEAVVGPVAVCMHSSSRPSAPGLLARHYAPEKPFLLDPGPSILAGLESGSKRVAALRFRRRLPVLPARDQVILSERGDLKEAAAGLFAALRELDAREADVIIAERVPARGLGLAINDRLRRAAARRLPAD